MSPNFKIDHIVIMVDDLSQAMADYTALGFTVLVGGTHQANPTHNALVVFQDGVYLEIIALRPGATEPQSDRLQKWVQARPGLVDMALLPADIEAAIIEARQRGLTVEDAAAGGRARPDGRRIEWQTTNLEGAGLPFFCADVTPRALRVPEGAAREHKNGVTGVADVTIAVTDLAFSARQYRALLGLEPQSQSSHILPEDTQTTTFSLEATTLTLAQPETENGSLQAYLASGGERPYSFTLRTSLASGRTQLDLGQTHGARIILATDDL